MYLSQTLPPGPHFFNRLILGQKIFAVRQISRIDKKYIGKVLLWLKFAFFKEQKNSAKFMRFSRFSQIQLPGGKIWDWHIILHYFSKHLTPMLTLSLHNIEMENLRARTPCVQQLPSVFTSKRNPNWDIKFLRDKMDTFSPADVCDKTYLFAKCSSPLLFLKKKKKMQFLWNEKPYIIGKYHYIWGK